MECPRGKVELDWAHSGTPGQPPFHTKEKVHKGVAEEKEGRIPQGAGEGAEVKWPVGGLMAAPKGPDPATSHLYKAILDLN